MSMSTSKFVFLFVFYLHLYLYRFLYLYLIKTYGCTAAPLQAVKIKAQPLKFIHAYEELGAFRNMDTYTLSAMIYR